MTLHEAPEQSWKCKQTSRLHLWNGVGCFLQPLYISCYVGCTRFSGTLFEFTSFGIACDEE